MPSYKLTYFNVMGRAELTRLLFAQGGVEYEDVRVEGEEWAKLKPTTLTGQLPILEVDGKPIYQSHAIARYVAAVCKLTGCNNLEAAQCDAVIETIAEISQVMTPLLTEKDEAKKEELKKTMFEEKIKPKFAVLEKMLAANGDVFVGRTITVADIGFFSAASFMDCFLPLDFADFPKLAALKDKVCKEPKIAAWIAKRPVTKM